MSTPWLFQKGYGLAPLDFFFSLFISLILGVLEQAAVMHEQTSKNRSAVLKNVCSLNTSNNLIEYPPLPCTHSKSFTVCWWSVKHEHLT